MTKSVTLNYTIAILAALALIVGYSLPITASAAVNSTNITVYTKNKGTINNTTESKAHTGHNTAEGSTAGNGEEGGDVENDGTGDYNNGGASGGNGGDGGNSGAGGLVNTGNATSNAGTENSLNGTDIDIDLTVAGEDVNSTYIGVETKNGSRECECESEINNTTRSRAHTGHNTADGSTAGNGEEGGEVEADGGGDYNNGGAKGGHGGDGGDSGLGGEVNTGNASSTAGTVNLLNTTFVRVRL